MKALTRRLRDGLNRAAPLPGIDRAGGTNCYCCGLTKFLEDGRLELDTNPVENSIRPVAMRESLCSPMKERKLSKGAESRIFSKVCCIRSCFPGCGNAFAFTELVLFRGVEPFSNPCLCR
ncbi:IS66 family transposase [Mesorhizobium sp. M4A.F.Ca.ET.022.05.2.1]|uniref:IS66 family transposase n=1 Tax=Mesorhizobium sp. M4A.F.Ca.ET.022.05.2.1 TaxID=2496653 RepID=UPI001FE0DF27|nr:IS66 family transposase [Mesorhizobium sp. M4A.F.Ca.ET.022.05.2.1]